MFKTFATLLFVGLTAVLSSRPALQGNTNLTTTAKAQLHNTGLISNYYYSSLDGSSFAFAVGQCTLYSVALGEYMHATCIDSQHINIQIYSSSDCSGSIKANVTYNETSAIFNCKGVNSYAAIGIDVQTNSCPTTKYIVYSALNVCSNVSSITWTSVYCNSTYGEIQYYSNAQCSDSGFTTSDIFNSTCKFLFENSEKINVFGIIKQCSVNPFTITTTATPTTTTTSKPSSANNYNINQIIFFFAALFCVLQF